MSKRIKGIIKGCQVPDTSKTGYRDVWNMGRAADTKKKWKVQGTNRPSI